MCCGAKTKISALFWTFSDIPAPFSYSGPVLLIKMMLLFSAVESGSTYFALP